jgi:xylulokinase
LTRIVGIDVGTTSVKGVAISEDGAVLARAEQAYALSTPRPGWVEQDPEVWWQAADAVLRELDAANAAGIGLSGQMHGLVALGADDRPLRPAILWNDGRTGAQCQQIERIVGLGRLTALTGNRALAGFTAPKLLWMREHEPELYARIAGILLPKDYVRLRLCGERATDVADASGTLLFDVGSRDWSQEMASALQIDAAWLPPACESPAVAGTAFGRVPVAAGAGDQAAGAVGMGVLDAGGPASVVLGTSGVVFTPLDAYRFEAEGRVHAFCHAVPGRWHAMGVILSAAGALRWVREATGNAPYGELLSEAGAWPAGTEGLLFAPYLAGERTPHADVQIRGGYAGLGLRHDRGALVRAVLEGVAFGLRDALDVLRAVDVAPAAGRASGGGAQSRLWLEIIASVLEMPLELCSVSEGAAFGAALLGGVAGGVWRDVTEACTTCVQIRETVEPRPAWVDVYRERHEAFRALYPALGAVRAVSGDSAV